MDELEGAWLGLLQGLTEFLPVSSSGHVIAGGWLLGSDEEGGRVPLSMVVLLHVATLVATVLVLRRELTALAAQTLRGLRTPDGYLGTEAGRTMLGVVVATIPTAVLGLGLAPHLDVWGDHPALVGSCFLLTAAALLATRRLDPARRRKPPTGAGGASPPQPTSVGRLSLIAFLLIGVAQGLAVMPGVSRSGATIVAGMAVGLRAADAFRFSFLLSIPAILGATVLELRHPEELGALGSGAIVGALVALVSGLGALVVLRRIVVAGRLWTFALYLVPLGTALMLWELTGSAGTD